MFRIACRVRFYPAIKSPGKSKIAEINRQKHLLYYFMDFQKLDTRVEVNDEWAEYLIRNKEILKDWVNYNLIGYLQDRNLACRVLQINWQNRRNEI